MTTIKIFLASSEELKPERLLIAELVTNLNYVWAEYDIAIRLVKWEYLDSSMGNQHKQQDYNDYLRECDMCVVLFWKEFGKYTKMELETAYELLNADSNLKVMSVMFKDETEMTEALRTFMECYYKSKYPELYNTFKDETQLKEKITQQILQCIQYKLTKNKENLAKNVRKLQKLLAVTDENEPEYKEYMFEFQTAQQALDKIDCTINELKQSIKGN